MDSLWSLASFPLREAFEIHSCWSYQSCVLLLLSGFPGHEWTSASLHSPVEEDLRYFGVIMNKPAIDI